MPAAVEAHRGRRLLVSVHQKQNRDHGEMEERATSSPSHFARAERKRGARAARWISSVTARSRNAKVTASRALIRDFRCKQNLWLWRRSFIGAWLAKRARRSHCFRNRNRLRRVHVDHGAGKGMEALSPGPHASAIGEWDPVVCHREKREGEAWASAAGWAVAATWVEREGTKAGLGENGPHAGWPGRPDLGRGEELGRARGKGEREGFWFFYSFISKAI